MGEKTEQPTSRRLEKAREKGQVAKSTEVGSTAVILVICAIFMARWNANMSQLDVLYGAVIAAIQQPFSLALTETGSAALFTMLYICAPLVLGAAATGVIAHMAQVGMLFSMEAAMPSLEKLSPMQWVKKVFSKKALAELIKSILKTVLLALILKYAILKNLDALLKAGMRSPEILLHVFSSIMLNIMMWCAVVFIIVAALDFLFQKHMHIKELMMSKDEVKNEYKEMDGDPHIKSQRKKMHQELANSTTASETRKASVLIVNPTHLAIALYYKKDETPLPIISAKGEGAVAAMMRQIAEEEGIPIMHNIPLAHDLYNQGRVSEYIPSELIEPVAEVLRWVQQLTDTRL